MFFLQNSNIKKATVFKIKRIKLKAVMKIVLFE